MTLLTCFRIRSEIGGRSIGGFDDVVNLDEYSVKQSKSIPENGFEAKVYVIDESPHSVPRGTFLQSGFDKLNIGLSTSPSALLVVKIPEFVRGKVKRDSHSPEWGDAGYFNLSDNRQFHRYLHGAVDQM